jgi:glutamine cyclotransferase
MLFLLVAFSTAAGLLLGPAPTEAQRNQVPPALLTPYEVLGSYPHSEDAFVEGLVWHDGGFYESDGLNGRSTLRRLDFPSGEVVQKADIPREYFAEGLTLVDDRLIQLTWQNKKGFVYDRASFNVIGDFHYDTEGWGITYDGSALIMSDGSSNLFFLDPNDFSLQRTLPVTLDGRPIQRINELEWIKGEVWANVWQTDWIIRIDPSSGQVVGVLDMTGLLPGPRKDDDDVLNGIAYDPETDRTFVTGKDWPARFEIRLKQ